LGCKDCGSKEVDAYSLYDEKKLVCQPCRMKKEGGASGSVSFLERQKWYKKHWKIDLVEWLENFSQLLVNADCAREWVKGKEHLKSCNCLEAEVKNLVDLFTGSLKEYHQKLEKCSCKKSEKVRVESDNYAWCDKCGESIPVASKKRVIKNRNDPRFWGLEVEEKMLCLECLKKLAEKMPISKKYTLNKYLKRKY
jgi:RNA polymerase-binding transcription factor DksA